MAILEVPDPENDIQKRELEEILFRQSLESLKSRILLPVFGGGEPSLSPIILSKADVGTSIPFYKNIVDPELVASRRAQLEQMVSVLWSGGQTQLNNFNWFSESAAPETIRARNSFIAVLEQISQSDDKRDLLNLFLLTYLKGAREELTGAISSNEGITGRLIAAVTPHKRNERTYLISKEFIKGISKTINRAGLHTVGDLFTTALVGDTSEDKNGFNAWQFFEKPRDSFNASHHEVLLKDRYDLDPAKVKFLQSIFTAGLELQEGRDASKDMLYSESLNLTRVQKLLKDLRITHLLIDSLRHSLKSEKVPESQLEHRLKGALVTMNSILDSNEKLLTDMAVAEAIQLLQKRIDVEVESHFDMDQRTLERRYVFAPGVDIHTRDHDVAVFKTDARGFTKMANEIGLTDRELGIIQSDTILSGIKEESKKYGLGYKFELKKAYKTLGDELMTFGDTVRGAVYFAYVLRTTLTETLRAAVKNWSGKNLKTHGQNIASFNDRVREGDDYDFTQDYLRQIYLSESDKEAVESEKDKDGKKRKLEAIFNEKFIRAKKINEAIILHPFDSRVAITYGRASERKEEIIGKPLNVCARLLEHDKDVDSTPYDVEVLEGGKFDNQNGIVLDDAAMTRLEYELGSEMRRTEDAQYNGYNVSVRYYVENDGTKKIPFIFRTIGPGSVNIKGTVVPRIWKLSLPNIDKQYGVLLAYVKKHIASQQDKSREESKSLGGYLENLLH
jgi:hypothetical protein